MIYGKLVKTVSTMLDSSFHYYLKLPPLGVRERVLDFLTCPRDKLNLVTAIPGEIYLKKSWQPTNLYFEMVFPILMAKTYRRCRLLDWKAVYNLSHVNPCFWQVIEKYLNNILGDLSYVQSIGRQRMDDLITMNPQCGIFVSKLLELQCMRYTEPWCQLTPIPTNVHLNFNKGGDEFRREQLEILQHWGTKIWDCFIKLPFNHSSPQLIQLIRVCLELMPNLRHLSIYHVGASFRRYQEASIYPDDDALSYIDQLPELSFLKSMKLDGESPAFAIVMRALVEKFGSKLKNLILHPVCSVEGRFAINATRMSGLDVTGTLEEMGKQTLQFLSAVGNAPLNVIHLTCVERNTKEFFFRIISVLGSHFGNTLEQLKIHITDWYLLNESDSSRSTFRSSVLPTEWRFPRLKLFQMNGFPIADVWPCLIGFPSLEKLCLGFLRPKNSLFSKQQGLQYPRQWVYLENCNIWRVLPRLNEIEMYCDGIYSTTRRKQVSDRKGPTY